MRPLRQQRRPPGLLGLLLLTLFVRALIPAGFMPATDRPFSFQICPDGFPAHLLKTSASAHGEHAHHHGDAGGHPDHHAGHGASDEPADTPRHSSANSEQCTFAAAGGPALFAFIATFAAELASESTVDSFDRTPAIETLRFRTPPARGPPALS